MMKITNYVTEKAVITTRRYSIIEDDRLNHTSWKRMYGDREYTSELQIVKVKEDVYALYDGEGGDLFPWGMFDLDNKSVSKYRKGLKEFEEMKFESIEEAVEFLITENLPVGKELTAE